MNLGFEESLDLATDILVSSHDIDFSKIEAGVCPSFPVIKYIKDIFSKSEIKVGSQDCFWENYGSFTASISAQMLGEIGCHYVILGHSERRRYQKETDKTVHKKLRQALSHDLTPIICVGETLDERRNFRSDHAVISQINDIFSGVELNDKKVIIAYEPVWAIGNQAVEPGEAEYMIKVIKHFLYDVFDSKTVEDNFKFLYGGSLKPENIASFMVRENIDGGLIGGASLKTDSFVNLLKNSIVE